MNAIDINLIHTIGKTAATIVLLLAFFLWTVKSNIRQSNRLFSAYLLLIAFDLCGLFAYEWLITHPYIDVLRRTSSLLQMPLFYLYVLSICFQDIKLKPGYLKHAWPFVIYLTFLLSQFVVLSYSEQQQLLQVVHSPESLIGGILGQLQYFFYIALILMTLFKYKKLYHQNYANYDHTAYHWLLQMTLVSLGAHIFAMTKDVLTLVANDSIVLMAHLFISLTVLGIICWFVLKALYHPSITRGINSKLEAIEQKTDNQSITPNPAIQQQVSDLNDYMNSEQPYLNPDLSIESLANQLKMPTKELSTLINHHIGQHFFKFINSYRIIKAQSMLRNPKLTDLSVLQILYEVGFNSKSSFNTYFKQTTGQTPSAYRKTHT